jgi:hypothetical protein
VAHRTVSGAPGGLRPELLSLGNFSGRRTIIHRTVRCTPDSVRCSKEARPPELTSLGNAKQLLRYNSSDMSGVHRTVRCILGATTTGDVAGAPDMSGVHRTVRCASDCPVHHTTVSLHQRSCLVVGAINTPTTPPFIASKFSSFQPLYKS